MHLLIRSLSSRTIHCPVRQEIHSPTTHRIEHHVSLQWAARNKEVVVRGSVLHALTYVRTFWDSQIRCKSWTWIPVMALLIARL